MKVGFFVVVLMMIGPAGAQVDYTTQIRPIFEKKCIRCHGPKLVKGGYRMDTRAAAMKGGNIVPGNAGESFLIEVVEEEVLGRMPPKGPVMTPGEIALVKRWINEGAKWTSAPKPKPVPQVDVAEGGVVEESVVPEAEEWVEEVEGVSDGEIEEPIWIEREPVEPSVLGRDEEVLANYPPEAYISKREVRYGDEVFEEEDE
ncbi:MAG: c-type cytochrome domain-containing protein, partial [Verrucomicrobiota bacterium]